MRLAAGIEYDGSRFHGWQTQPHARSVQACLEQALARVADHPLRVQCAGRTDTGVHASAQVVHFDSEARRTPRNWRLGANVNLPDDIALTWIRPVDDDFHARFGAIARAYRYVLLNRGSRSALLHRRVTWMHRPLDVARMNAAARALIGEHDFTSYRALGCQARSPVREIRRLELRRHGDFVVMDIEANAFLHHMVRNIIGVLAAIGRGDEDIEWAGEILARRDRARGGVTAPPDGLYLTRVDYPARFGLPTTPPPAFWENGDAG